VEGAAIVNGQLSFTQGGGARAYGYIRAHAVPGTVVEITCEVKASAAGTGQFGINAYDTYNGFSYGTLDNILPAGDEWKPYTYRYFVPQDKPYVIAFFGLFQGSLGTISFRNIRIKYDSMNYLPDIRSCVIKGYNAQYSLDNTVGRWSSRLVESVGIDAGRIKLVFKPGNSSFRPNVICQCGNYGEGAGKFCYVDNDADMKTIYISIRNSAGAFVDATTILGYIFIQVIAVF
jgi:hypothetical protein